MKLKNKCALVTGAGQGIGLAIAKRLNAEGCRVALLGPHAGKVTAAAAQLTDCIGVRCDVSKLEDIEAAIQTCVDAFGGIDILVNNAGILPKSKVFDVTEDEFDRGMAVNVKGVFFMIQKAAPYLKESSCPRVINIGSLAGRMGGFETSMVYTASKGAICSLTMGLARQLAPYKITVNAVCPGTTETPITSIYSDEVMASLLARIPMGRLGQPNDTAAAVAFLASEEAGWITGVQLDVNGGMYMG